METTKELLDAKISEFFRKSFAFYGKEIYLESQQNFSIDQLLEGNEHQQEGEYDFRIQYGFPSSGSVSLKVRYFPDKKQADLGDMRIYAPPADKEFMIANYAQQNQIGELNISSIFGLDIGTQEHTTLESFIKNPNCLKMLDLAISDLNKAEVLGQCEMVVSASSNVIPCSNSTNIPRNMGRNL